MGVIPEFISLIDRVSSSSNPRTNCSKKNRQKRAEVLARYVAAGFHRGIYSLTYSNRGCTRNPKRESRFSRKKARDLRFVSDLDISLSTYDENFLQRLLVEQRSRFEKEVHLLLGFIHSFGMNTMRDLTAAGAQQQSRAHPNSWLAQQRSNVCKILQRT